MSNIVITELDSSQTNEYTDFVAKHKNSLFYHGIKYKNFILSLLQCQERYLIATRSGSFSGIFPLMFLSQSRGIVYNSLPFFGSNGGIICDDEDSYIGLISSYNSLVSEVKVVSSTVIENPFHLMPTQKKILKSNYLDYRIGQFTKIHQCVSEDYIFKIIDPSAKRNINKAIRKNVKVEIDNDSMDTLQKIHYENMVAIGGKSKEDRFFSQLKFFFSPEKDYNIYVAKQDGVIIAALLIFYFNNIVEYFIPATKSEFREVQPLSLILLTAMVDAAKMGYVWWNWGGTWASQMGVYRFKRKWGAKEKKYYYYTQLNNLDLLNQSSTQILADYPNFFVLPFSCLKG